MESTSEQHEIAVKKADNILRCTQRKQVHLEFYAIINNGIS